MSKIINNIIVQAQTIFSQEKIQNIGEIVPLPNHCYLQDRTGNLEQDLLLLKQEYKENYVDLLPRKLIQLPLPQNVKKENVKANSLKILQFNMLADGLSGIYFSKKTEKSFLGINTKSMEWTYRGLRILELITQHDCDIICLQECDGLPFFEPYMKQKGYAVKFQPKTLSPVIQVEKEIQEDRKDNNIKLNLDGLVIFYKEDKLKITEDVMYIDMSKNKEKINALAIPFTFKLNDGKKVNLLVITTHPKSTKDEDGEKLRVRQMKLLLQDLITEEKFKNKVVLLACDLNSTPVNHVKGYPPLCYSTLTKDFEFQSVYGMVNKDKQEPPYTTLKKREHGVDKHCLDYIFVKNNTKNVKFDIIGYLEIPKCEDDVLLPNWFYPSDHFHLMAHILFE